MAPVPAAGGPPADCESVESLVFSCNYSACLERVLLVLCHCVCALGRLRLAARRPGDNQSPCRLSPAAARIIPSSGKRTTLRIPVKGLPPYN